VILAHFRGEMDALIRPVRASRGGDAERQATPPNHYRARLKVSEVRDQIRQFIFVQKVCRAMSLFGVVLLEYIIKSLSAAIVQIG